MSLLRIERDAVQPSSKRPISFMRPVRSSSLIRSTRPEPQMPCGATSPMTPSLNCAVVVDATTSSIAPSSAGMPQAIAPPSNAGPAGQEAARMRSLLPRISSVFVPMSITATRRSSLAMIDRQHARGRIGADVAADDRAAVHAGLGMDRQQRLLAGRRQAGVGALALFHFDFGDRAVGRSGRSSKHSGGKTGRASSNCRRRPFRKSFSDRPGNPRSRG